MTTKIIQVDLQATDKTSSMRARVADAKKLNSELEKSKALATGTRTGAAAYAGSSPQAAFAGEGTAYGNQRGTAGITGAAGRDFANQAQGLGGVVRLYATYAANLFAVGAAYRALSEAQNTANMVDGLNQLGAASGVALGSLAKDFAQASGGAISLRESMEATAKAISSGMSASQFIQLGEVAKKASQALGVNMSDAVSRLTRGITKLEPELLDELGLFTKVGKSTEDYAKSVGKSVTSLTDFERRQAFANAVLAEGQQKFSEINIPTNPYDKLVASLKNVATEGLQVLNTVLVPIANVLSSSPTALTAVLGSLGLMVLKQAMPALGQYRQELQASASIAAEVAQEKADTAKQIEEKQYAEMRQRAEASANVEAEAMGRAEEKLKLHREGIFRKYSKAYQVLQKDVREMTDEDIKFFNTRSEMYEKQNKLDIAGKYRDVAKAISASRAAEAEYDAVVKQTTESLLKQQSVFSARGRAEIAAKRARDISTSKSIVSSAANNTEFMGMSGAWATMQKSIKESEMGKVRSGFTTLAGGISIATTAAVSFISAIQGVAFVITAVVAALALLYTWVQGNAKEMESFSSSLETANSMAETAAGTYKKFGDALTIDSLVAKSQAMDSLANSTSKLVSDLEAADKAANMFDRGWDNIKSLVDSGLKDNFAKTMPQVIQASLDSLSDPKLKQEVNRSISEIFGTTNISKDFIEDLDPKELLTKFKALTKVLDEVGKKSIAAAAPLTEVRTAFKDINEKYTALSNSMTAKDEVTQFALSTIKATKSLTDALSSSQNTAATLNEIMKDTSQIRMFPPETVQSLLAAAAGMKALQDEANAAQLALDQANKKLDASILGEKNASPVTREILVKMKIEAEADIAKATDRLNSATTSIARINNDLTKGLKLATENSFKMLEAPLVAAVAKAGIEAGKTALSFLPKTPETIKMAANYDKAAINVQINQLTATERLTAAVELNTLATQKSSLEVQRQQFISTGDIMSARIIGEEIAKITNRENAFKAKDIYKALQSGEVKRENGVEDVVANRMGVAAQVAQLVGQKLSIDIAAKANSAAAQKNIENDTKQENLKSIELRQKSYTDSIEYRGLSAKDKIIKDNDLRKETDRLKYEISNLQLEVEIAQAEAIKATGGNAGIAAGKILEKLETTRKAREASFSESQAAQDRNATNSAGIEGTKATLTAMERQISLTQELKDIENQRAEDVQSVDRRILDQRLQLGEVTETEYNALVKSYDDASLAKEYDTKVTEINNKAMLEGIAIHKAFVEAGYVLSAELRDRIALNESRTQAELDSAKAVYDARVRERDLMSSLTDRQRAYADIFKSSFEGMADAITEFATTGKFSFKEMINSMLADLLRYELRMNMMEIYKGFGGGKGIASLITSFLPGGSGGSGGLNLGDMPLESSIKLAKGGAFDSGVLKFADGGAFTNSVVNRPTKFNAAEMGEAGPEAIVPLARMPGGNLGIQSSGSSTKVDVVVNNYSNAQAETVETTDSRGNRKIEVVIGEMVSAEMSRTNSPVQSSLKSNFGTQPMLTRR